MCCLLPTAHSNTQNRGKRHGRTRSTAVPCELCPAENGSAGVLETHSDYRESMSTLDDLRRKNPACNLPKAKYARKNGGEKEKQRKKNWERIVRHHARRELLIVCLCVCACCAERTSCSGGRLATGRTAAVLVSWEATQRRGAPKKGQRCGRVSAGAMCLVCVCRFIGHFTHRVACRRG